jgi:plastocyanin
VLLLAVVPATAARHSVAVGPHGTFTFSPADITISVGDTVHWYWRSDEHNVRSGVPGSPTPYFYSGPPALAGTTFDVVFDMAFIIANQTAGFVYDYYCEPHGTLGMVGSVTVTGVTAVTEPKSTWGMIKAIYRS